jgi:hypothetical protein
MNMTKQMKIITDYGKRELYLISSMMCMLSITIQQSMKSLCSSKVLSSSIYAKETQAVWDANLQAIRAI